MGRAADSIEVSQKIHIHKGISAVLKEFPSSHRIRINVVRTAGWVAFIPGPPILVHSCKICTPLSHIT